MAKIQDGEICPCGSGQTFGQCHGKKIRERSSPEISQHIRLEVIPEPDPNSRSVFHKMPGTGTIFLQGYESNEALDCGSCGAPLAVGVRRDAIGFLVFQCADCGAFNDTMGSHNLAGQAPIMMNQPGQEAERMPENGRVYEQRVVYLTDLLDKRKRPPTLEGYTFTGCQIHGPVIIYSMGSSFSGCNFQNDVEAMLYEIPEGATKVGIVGLVRCTFKDCNIEGVGIAGTPADLSQLRAALGIADPG